MLQNTNQFTANNTPTSFSPVEVETPDRDKFFILTEPRPTPLGWSWNRAPNGTPIWGGFNVGMSLEDIRGQFPMLIETPGGALWGLCKIFGFDARLTCEIDPDGELESLFIDLPCESEAEAARTLHTLFVSWQGELQPTRFTGYAESRGELQGGNVHVDFYLMDYPAPGVLLCVSAVDPESYTVHYDQAVSPVSLEGENT